MAYLTLKKSLPANLIKKPIGVTTKKKTAPITIGEITAPSNIPNLNHNLFKGFKIFEFVNPNIKKTNEIIIDQTLIASALIRGYNPINKKTTKKTIPKLLLEPIFTSFM